MENPGNIDLSVVIVTYNSEEDIADCLQTFYKQAIKLNFETIIVDNHSIDNTLKVISEFIDIFKKNIIIIKNNENLGFTSACNQGIKISKGNNILLLNPDTKAIDNSVELLYNKLNSGNYGAIAPQLLYENGSIQYSCRNLPDYKDLFLEIFLISKIFSKNVKLGRWKMKYFSHNEESEVEQPMAAVIMIKKSVLREIDYFDERYFMFFNDVDLCKKIKDLNHKILFYPQAKFLHKKGTSVFKQRTNMIKIWNSDCLKYFQKHYNRPLSHFILKILLSITGFFRILFKM